jgi:hypothetical protein
VPLFASHERIAIEKQMEASQLLNRALELVAWPFLILWSVVLWLWGQLAFKTRSESIYSLREIPVGWAVCLNDVIERSDPGFMPADPRPRRPVWIDREDFQYRRVMSQQHHIGQFGEFAFNRRIDYAPENPNHAAMAFVSGTRRVSHGHVRTRRKRALGLLGALLKRLAGL